MFHLSGLVEFVQNLLFAGLKHVECKQLWFLFTALLELLLSFLYLCRPQLHTL